MCIVGKPVSGCFPNSKHCCVRALSTNEQHTIHLAHIDISLSTDVTPHHFLVHPYSGDAQGRIMRPEQRIDLPIQFLKAIVHHMVYPLHPGRQIYLWVPMCRRQILRKPRDGLVELNVCCGGSPNRGRGDVGHWLPFGFSVYHRRVL